MYLVISMAVNPSVSSTYLNTIGDYCHFLKLCPGAVLFRITLIHCILIIGGIVLSGTRKITGK